MLFRVVNIKHIQLVRTNVRCTVMFLSAHFSSGTFVKLTLTYGTKQTVLDLTVFLW
jgi:hypothetical protein